MDTRTSKINKQFYNKISCNKFNGMASRWFFSAHVVQWSVELWSEVRCKKCSPAHWSPMILIIWTCCHKTCILNRLDFNRVRNKICMHIVERKNNITLNRSNERFDWLCSMTIKTWKSTHANKKKTCLNITVKIRDQLLGCDSQKMCFHRDNLQFWGASWPGGPSFLGGPRPIAVHRCELHPTCPGFDHRMSMPSSTQGPTWAPYGGFYCRHCNSFDTLVVFRKCVGMLRWNLHWTILGHCAWKTRKKNLFFSELWPFKTHHTSVWWKFSHALPCDR